MFLMFRFSKAGASVRKFVKHIDRGLRVMLSPLAVRYLDFPQGRLLQPLLGLHKLDAAGRMKARLEHLLGTVPNPWRLQTYTRQVLKKENLYACSAQLPTLPILGFLQLLCKVLDLGYAAGAQNARAALLLRAVIGVAGHALVSCRAFRSALTRRQPLLIRNRPR